MRMRTLFFFLFITVAAPGAMGQQTDGALGNTATANNPLNNIFWIGTGTSWSGGTDIGAQFNAAEAALPAAGGEIDVVPPTTVPTGGSVISYNFSTPMVFNKTVKLKCVKGGFANGANSPSQPSLLVWTSTATPTVPPVQIGTPIAVTSITGSVNTATVTCATTCNTFVNETIALQSTSSSAYNYAYTGAKIFTVTSVISSTKFTFTYPSAPNATGGYLSLNALAQGSSIEGCQFSDLSSTAAPPTFIDVDSFSGDVLLDSVIIDSPPVLATTGAFRFGNIFPINAPQCSNTFARTAGVHGYLVLKIRAGFTGYRCLSVWNSSSEWQLGDNNSSPSTTSLAEVITCFRCSAEANNLGGQQGIVIYQALAVKWYGTYFEHNGNNTYAVEIPTTALQAYSIVFDGSYVNAGPDGSSTYPSSAFYTGLASSQLTVTNSTLEGQYNSGGFIVNNASAKIATVEGNYANVVNTIHPVATTTGSITCGNFINGTLITPCYFGP